MRTTFCDTQRKYQVSHYEYSFPSSLLYFILRKFELGIVLIEFELNWLKEHEHEFYRIINLPPQKTQ